MAWRDSTLPVPHPGLDAVTPHYLCAETVLGQGSDHDNSSPPFPELKVPLWDTDLVLNCDSPEWVGLGQGKWVGVPSGLVWEEVGRASRRKRQLTWRIKRNFPGW